MASIFIPRSGPGSIEAAIFQRSNRGRFHSIVPTAHVKHAGGWAADSRSIPPKWSWTGLAHFLRADWVQARARVISSGAWLVWRNRLALTFAHRSSNFPPKSKILSFTGIANGAHGSVAGSQESFRSSNDGMRRRTPKATTNGLNATLPQCLARSATAND